MSLYLKNKNNHVYAINDKRGVEAVLYDFLEIREEWNCDDKFVQRVRDARPRINSLVSPCRRHIPFKPGSKNTWTVYFYYLYNDTGRCRESLIYDLHLPAGR